MKRLIVALAALALAGSLVTACSKTDSSSSNTSADSSATAAATASGPVTDSADSGMKSSGSPAPAAGGAVAAGDKAHGEKIFSQNCSGCHGAGGAGGGIGPTLKGEKVRKDYPHTIAWIKNPQPPMPKLYPSPLSEQDVDDVAAYVQSL